MSVIENLIFDRTQADVNRVFELKNKILTLGLSALTAEERSEYMAGMKGAYNATDLNRVGEAVAFIANRMISLPEELADYRDEKGVADDVLFQVPYDASTVVVTAKQDWTMADVPTQSQVGNLLSDLLVLRQQLVLPTEAPDVPTSLDGLTYVVANEIEYLLFIINLTLTEVENALYALIELAAISFMQAAEINCGE